MTPNTQEPKTLPPLTDDERKALTREQRAELIKEFYTSVNTHEFAEYLGIPHGTLMSTARRLGLQKPTTMRKKAKKSRAKAPQPKAKKKTKRPGKPKPTVQAAPPPPPPPAPKPAPPAPKAEATPAPARPAAPPTPKPATPEKTMVRHPPAQAAEEPIPRRLSDLTDNDWVKLRDSFDPVKHGFSSPEFQAWQFGTNATLLQNYRSAVKDSPSQALTYMVAMRERGLLPARALRG